MRWQSGVSKATVVQSEDLSLIWLTAASDGVNATAGKTNVHQPPLISCQS